MENDLYFTLRNVDQNYYSDYELPAYLLKLLSTYSKDINILDFGCGYGQMMSALDSAGYSKVVGADVDKQAIEFSSRKYEIYDAREKGWSKGLEGSFDLIIMSHVLEHIKKDEMIEELKHIRSLLRDEGALLVVVPNAQANTGCYWAYEDFTHEFLFTSGSLYYVLKAAGYADVRFVDPDCLAGSRWFSRIVKGVLLRAYKTNRHFWNKVTGSAYHAASPQIYSYEIKALVKK